ncbi:hypothetical protein HRJ45_21105 [Vibrio coralliilyticus]|uniref:hypothetical protein n=1 Tax=Vibrio coralliilyticus TaxID=190893 RepID=UPI0015603BFC|nr:hypothetical protein [Vibrio coralliilyticus]NRF27272.1 hypothetical protein [Vibrio coralliilyticus]NRF81614.1 hypothetical protein [Vibrio coralliilyticus]
MKCKFDQRLTNATSLLDLVVKRFCSSGRRNQSLSLKLANGALTAHRYNYPEHGSLSGNESEPNQKHSDGKDNEISGS